MVRKFAEADEMEGMCVTLYGAYQGYSERNNVYLILEHDSGTKFRRIGVFEEGWGGGWYMYQLVARSTHVHYTCTDRSI